MGQETDLPKINLEVNREEQEKKRSGLAALLFRFGSASGGGGFGGLLGAGGLLATKAGIIGLILVGTTVAGSLGVVAYKLFGPTASDRSDASFSRLFAPKPKDAAGKDAPTSANGVSQSLQYLADANSKGEAAPQDQAAPAASAAPADASASAAPPPLKNDNALGSTVAKLKTDHKIGALPPASGSGSSASLLGSAGAAKNAASLTAGTGGNLSGMAASRAGTGGLQALRSRTMGGGAVKQLGAVRHDQAGATSSQGAGRTYDGNAAAPSPASASENSSAGAQNSAADQTPKVNPGGGSSGNQFPSSAVPSVTGSNVTPWQAAINTAMLLTMLAAGLLFAASMVAKMKFAAGLGAAQIHMWVGILAGLAAAVALGVIALGAEIGGGKYGQPLQGQLLCLAGGFMVAGAGVLMAGALSVGAGTGDEANHLAMSGSMNILMMVCGGAALAAMAWAYMAPKKSYDAGLFQNGRPPDWDHPYQSSQVGRLPSQVILDRYLA